MAIDRENFVLREHCHIDDNVDGDRFVGVKADSTNAMIYFPLGYELPEDDDELRRDVKNLFIHFVEILASHSYMRSVKAFIFNAKIRL